ncbi:MAG: divalent-cation tolerance protein CutA [Desulfovibrionales bacterium]|nr:divalent-cation tolerance protein CutA [Desulfovibrionales bacterium]
MSFLVYMTAPNMEEARYVAKQLIEKRLAACANIIPHVESVYRWEGDIVSSEEVVLIVKTSEDKVTMLTQTARELHSYNMPCILSLCIAGGNPEFLSWIENETR